MFSWVAIGLRAVEAARGEFGHPRRVRDMALVFRELLEHRQLIRFLEAAEADAHRAGFRRDDHDRVCAQYAAAIAVTQLLMPGPFWPITTPWRPDTRA